MYILRDAIGITECIYVVECRFIRCVIQRPPFWHLIPFLLLVTTFFVLSLRKYLYGNVVLSRSYLFSPSQRDLCLPLYPFTKIWNFVNNVHQIHNICPKIFPLHSIHPIPIHLHRLVCMDRPPIRWKHKSYHTIKKIN